MKIGAMYNCHGETEYLGYSLRSVAPFVDRIIITRSRDRHYAKMGIAAQGDFEVASRTITDLARMQFQDLGDVNDLTLTRNHNLDLLRDMDWIIQVDADEVYREEDMLILVDLLSKTDKDMIHLYFYQVVSQFDRRLQRTPHVERVYRNIPGMKFVLKHNVMSYPDGRTMESVSEKMETPDIHFFHYGWVGTIGKLARKLVRHQMQLRDMGEGDGDVYDEALKVLHNQMRDDYLATDTIPISLSEHPAVMRDHPWFGKPWKEILFNFAKM